MSLWTHLVKCRYNAAQFITVLHVALPRKQWQKMNKILESQHTPSTSPSRGSYRVPIIRILEKFNRVLTAPRCINNLGSISQG